MLRLRAHGEAHIRHIEPSKNYLSQLNKESGASNEQGASAEQGVRGLK